MPIGPSTVATGYDETATAIEQQRRVFKNPRGLGYYYALFRTANLEYRFYKSSNGIDWASSIIIPTCDDEALPSLWIVEDNTNSRLLVYVIYGFVFDTKLYLNAYKIDDDSHTLDALFIQNEVLSTGMQFHNPSITLDSSGYIWVTWTNEFTNKGKQRNKLRATRSDTPNPVTAPGWETIVDVYGEQGSTDYPDGIRCNSGPFLRSELVPLTAFKDVGVVFSYHDYNAPHTKLKACTLDYSTQIDEGTMVTLDDIHIDLIHSSVAESGANSDVFIGYKDSSGDFVCLKWDISAATSASFGTIQSAGEIDSLALSIDKNADPDTLYAFYTQPVAASVYYRTTGVDSASWSSSTNIYDDSEELDYLSTSYQDWDLDGDIQIIYTRQTNDTVRFWAVGVGGQTYQKTYQIDALFKKLGIEKTPTIDSAFQKKDIQETLDIDSLFSLRTEKTADIDSVFQRQYELQRQIDSVFKRLGVEKTPLVDALFMLRIQEELDLDALFKKLDILETFGIDSDFLKQGIEESFAIDARFGAVTTYEISRQVDALFQRLGIEQTFDIDALMVLRLEIQTQIDTLIQRLGIEKTADFDALLVLRLELQRGVDALIQKLGIEETFSLDALIVLRSELQRQVDTLFQRQGIEETVALDVAFSRTFEKTLGIDADFLKENIEIQRQVDALFKRLDILESFDIDVVLLKENVVKSFAIDVRFGAVQTFELSRQVDALFKRLGVEETVGIDTLLRRLGIERTADVDTLFQKLDIPLTVAVDALLKRLDIEETASVDVFLKKLGAEETISLDTLLVLRIQKTATLNAFFRETVTKQALLDAIFTSAIEATFALDALFMKEGAELQRQVDTLFQKTIPADLLLDTILKSVGIQRGFGLDVRLWIPWHVAVIELKLGEKEIYLSVAKKEGILVLGDKEAEMILSEKEKELRLGEKEICSR